MADEKPPNPLKSSRPLRRRAEELLRADGPDISKMSSEDVQALIHELQVHQIELELQNEELREAQLDLADSRDRYADLYEFAPIGYLTLDEKGRVLQSNLTAAAMLGVERRDLVGTAVFRFVTRESRDDCHLHLQGVFAGEAKQTCELRMRRKDGAPLTVRLESIVQQQGTAETRCCRTALVDTTDQTARRLLQRLNEELEQRVRSRTADLRRRTDQLAEQSAELERREREFRTLADNVPALFSYVDRNQRYRYVNRRYEEFFRRPAAEIVGRTVSDLLGPQRFGIARPHVEAVLRGEEAVYEAQFDFDDGPHTMHVHCVPDSGVQDGVRGFFTLVTDITALKRAEEATREGEERMEAILNTATDAIITIDRRGIIVDVNPATEQMFGYGRDELSGRNVKLLMPPPYSGEHDGYIARYLETGEARIIGVGREVEGRRKDGTVFPIDVSVSEIEHLGLFTGIVRDISSRKKTEQQLERYRSDLRAMSSELMLTEERERRQLAQDLHDSLGQALFLINRKLPETSLGDQAVEEIRTILDEAARTVNALTFELSPPILRDLGLRAAVRWLARDLNKRYGLSIHIEDDPQPLPIDDRVAVVVFRSVRELLINAAKHARSDLAVVSFRRSDHSMRIAVEDQGKGFDPGAQSSHVEAGHFGLFSIRERLEYLGGALTIRSAPGEGTTVTLTVPLAAQAEAGTA